MHERLTSPQATILKDLALRAGLSGRVSLSPWQRQLIVPLWRRELVEIWFRQTPDGDAVRRGPFYALTTAGYALGAAIWAASRQQPVSTRSRRKTRHNLGGKQHDEDSRLRSDPRPGVSGRRLDRPDSRRDRDLDP